MKCELFDSKVYHLTSNRDIDYRLVVTTTGQMVIWDLAQAQYSEELEFEGWKHLCHGNGSPGADVADFVACMLENAGFAS